MNDIIDNNCIFIVVVVVVVVVVVIVVVVIVVVVVPADNANCSEKKIYLDKKRGARRLQPPLLRYPLMQQLLLNLISSIATESDLYFCLNLKYLGWPYKAYNKIAKNGDFCKELCSENNFEAVLATFCCYEHGTKAFEAVQKIATAKKEYRKCSLCVIVCLIAKI